MKDQYEKSKETRLKNNPNAYSEMGKVGGKKKRSWMTGDSENARRIQNLRWQKVRELKAEQQDEAKQALEDYKTERGENE